MFAMLLLQVIAEFSEHGRQLPVLEYRSVIQVGRLAAEHHEIMLRNKSIFAGGITSFMPSNRLISDHDLNVIYVGLHGRGPECECPWHAVAVLVEGDRLVLVDLARIADAIIKAAFGHRDRGGTFLFKASADRFALTRRHTREVLITTITQISVQFSDVSYLWDGSGPAPL